MNYIEMLQTHSVNECDRLPPQATRWRRIGIGLAIVCECHRYVLDMN